MQCDLVHVNGLWIFYGIRLTKWYHVGERKIGQSGQSARCSSAGKSLGNWHDLLNACPAVCVCGGVKQGIKSSPVLCDEMESQHRDGCGASAPQRARSVAMVASWRWICFSTLAVAWLVLVRPSVCHSDDVVKLHRKINNSPFVSSVLIGLRFCISIRLVLPPSGIMAGPWRRTEPLLNCDFIWRCSCTIVQLIQRSRWGLWIAWRKEMLCPGLSHQGCKYLQKRWKNWK